jgi:hypothetical protein
LNRSGAGDADRASIGVMISMAPASKVAMPQAFFEFLVFMVVPVRVEPVVFGAAISTLSGAGIALGHVVVSRRYRGR